jgi:hypothetical protein
MDLTVCMVVWMAVWLFVLQLLRQSDGHTATHTTIDTLCRCGVQQEKGTALAGHGLA